MIGALVVAGMFLAHSAVFAGVSFSCFKKRKFLQGGFVFVMTVPFGLGWAAKILQII